MKILMSLSRNLGILLILILMQQTTLCAQDIENNYQTRTLAEVSFEPLKNFKINLLPELRFEEDFTLDKYLIEGEVVYKAKKFLSLGASYRFGGNLREDKDTEYFNRFGLSATVKKDFNRFEAAFRLRYTNDSDDDISNQVYMRYKASVEYDIQNCKLTPFVGIEAFQEVPDAGLYKVRYLAGMDYKLFKNNYLGLNYKLDYFHNEYKNNHIVSARYKIKF